MINYAKAIAKFDIVDKAGQVVSFIPNKFQLELLETMTNKNLILKSRQIGFTSLILAIFTVDFLLTENSRSVCISHDGPSATKLLDRVKYFIDSAESKGLKINLKYNSRNELVNADKNSSFYIGMAGSKSFGRGDTLSNLHLSEFAFYPDPERLLSSALQAVVPDGKTFIESTACGLNFFKTLWDESKRGVRPFKTHFFGNNFYSEAFLLEKKSELGDQFPQEYPATDLEAFLSSGNPFFDRDAMANYLKAVKPAENEWSSFYDMAI